MTNPICHANRYLDALSVLAVSFICFVVIGANSLVWADDDDRGKRFEVTVTNLTQGQRFTPILVATHKKGLKLFELGKQASPQLETVAEDGNVGPLTALLRGMPEVLDVTDSEALLPPMGLLSPGASVTLLVNTRGSFDHISVASMLIPTNDAFFALNGVEGPTGNSRLTHFSPAYDAGTERNDEICRPGDPPKGSIPGPDCMTPPPSGLGTVENSVVHIHSGIHGIGGGVATSTLNPSVRDWRNPVAKITIRRID